MVRTIKFLQMLLILSIFSLNTASQAWGGDDGGGSHPWPWGLEIPFPWNDVQGIWKVENQGQVYYFGFRRVEQQRLFITQFDASRCVILGSGPGYIRTKRQKYVVAQITLKETGEAYRMAIYAFAEEDSPEPPVGGVSTPIPELVMVARINSMNNTGREIAVQMVRISSQLEYTCIGQDKKIRF